MIPVRYSCPECGVDDVTVQVGERGPSLGVVLWMERVIVACSADHARRSPHCHPKSLKDVKIPFPKGDDGIGVSAADPMKAAPGMPSTRTRRRGRRTRRPTAPPTGIENVDAR